MRDVAGSALNRWLDWQPTDRIFRNSLEIEPTKPTKPPFDGFDGSTLAPKPKIETSAKASSLKGGAVELWRDGDRYFLVADEEDRQAAIARKMGSPSEVWSVREIEIIAQIRDQGVRDEMQRWKRAAGGTVRTINR